MRGSLRDHQREVRGILIIKSVASRGCGGCDSDKVYPEGILKAMKGAELPREHVQIKFIPKGY